MVFKAEDLFEDLGIRGIAAGIGAVVLAPVLIPAVAKASKPVAKAIIKGGIVAYKKSIINNITIRIKCLDIDIA